MRRYQIALLAEDANGRRVPGVSWSLYRYDPAAPFFVKSSSTGAYSIGQLPDPIALYSAQVGGTSTTAVVSAADGRPASDVFVEAGEYAAVGTVGSRNFVFVKSIGPELSSFNEADRVSVESWLNGGYQPSELLVSHGAGRYHVNMFSKSESSSHVFTLGPDASGLHILQGLRSGVLQTLDPVAFTAVADNVVVVAPTIRNVFTTTVGDFIEAVFYGPALSFKSHTDDRGGVWRISVDGTFIKDISVWAASSGTLNQEISRDLGFGHHVVRAEFVGNDPDNAPSTGAGTARGWFSMYTDGRPDGDETFHQIEFKEANTGWLMSASNVEFAIRLNSGHWVPSHSGDLNSTQNIVKSHTPLTAITDTLSTTPAGEFVHEQEYSARDESASTVELWTGKLSHVFTPGKVIVLHEIEIGAADVPISYGYLAMMPSDPAMLVSFETPRVHVQTFLSDDSSQFDFENPTTSCRASFSDGSEVVCELNTPLSSSGFELDPYTTQPFLRHGTSKVKFYWQMLKSGGVLKAGTKIKTKQTLHVRKRIPLV